MNITAENQFTPWRLIESAGNNGIDITIENPNGATVTVQRKTDGLITDVGTYTIATSTNFISASTSYFRVGVKTGNFGTSAFNVGIGG